MPSKTSKRVRKQRESQSLKSKQQGQQQHWQDVLAEELGDPDFEGDGSNALILPATTKGAGGAAASATHQAAAGAQPALSKSQLKKLKQVQLKKQRREQLSLVITQLHSSSLPEEQLGLLRPLHQRGAKETKKQRLRRALKLQRAGLTDVEGAEELLQPRRVRGVKRDVAAADGSSSSSDSSDGSDDGEEKEGHGSRQEQQRPAGNTAQDSSDGDDDEDDIQQRPAKQAKTTAVAVGQQKLQQQQQQEAAKQDEEKDPAVVLQQQKAQLAALRAEAKALKAHARAEAAAEGADVLDEAEAEEAAAAKAAAAERAAAAAAGPTRVVHLQRPPEIEAARQQLPIIGLEQEIMEGINHNDVVVLCGETGCGKTTQVPQFLLEAGYGCKDFPERAGAICITQPRRVAAISTAERVAAELGVKLGTTVGYQVRHDRRVGATSAVRFLTDGVLMRQLQSDFLLRPYSIILLDEAHERSLNTDLLLGMLSRLVPLRRRLHEQWKAAGCTPAAADSSSSSSTGPVYPLKLVIMSATLRTSDFTENTRLFKSPPPVLSVPARQFPVTIHFAKHTELHDYLGAAVRKVCRIHKELPGGGILLFLTGQREVQVAVRRIRQAFAKKSSRAGGRGRQHASSAAAAAAAGAAAAAAGQQQEAAAEDADDDGAAAGADAAEMAADAADAALEADLLDAAAGDAAGFDDYEQLERDEDEEEVVVMGGDGWTPEELAAAEARFEEVYGLKLSSGSQQGAAAAAGAAAGQQQQERDAAPVHVLPLYAMLPQAQQAAVFKPVPAGHRLIVVATNVAETSITIPGIRYVVDAGRSKQKLLEAGGTAGGDGAVGRYAVDWVSKAAAEQRAGRAGRTGPGHVYRLYSSAHYNDSFRQHTDPEIANTPLEGVVLLLKAMGVDKVSNFPFPSPPDPEALQSATRCLIRLSALQPERIAAGSGPAAAAAGAAGAAVGSGPLTAIGRAMAVFPVTPRHSRMLLQLAIWQQQQQGNAPVSGGAGVNLAAVGGVGAAAAAKALPYAVALAAALSVESPFMHIDALNAETEAAAADADGSDAAAAAAAAADGEPDAEASSAEQQRRKQLTAEAKAANRKKMQAASAAHARFRSPYGDALSALNALSAYEAAAAAEGGVEEFCAANFLHARHLREMSQLRQQLARTLLQLQQGLALEQQQPHLPALAVNSGGGAAAEAQQLMQQLLSGLRQGPGQQELLQPLPPPSAAVLEVLRRSLAAGWCDQVARRVRSADYINKLSEQGRLQRHATRYMPACLAEEVYLHPRSCLASTAPEYVVYMSIVRTAKRPYMALVTSVEPHWLADSGSSLCTVSEPLTEPNPVYNPDLDRVLAWHDASYSPHDWGLPRLLLTHPDSNTRAAVFAAALLGGRVLPALAALSGSLVAPAASAARPELAGLARVGEVLQALQSKQVFSRASLAAAWAEQPTFLKQQLSLWLHKQHRHVLDSVWPQLLQEAADGAVAGTPTQRKNKKGTKRKHKHK